MYSLAMHSLRIQTRTIVVACLPFVLAACVWGADSEQTPTASVVSPDPVQPVITERYPADVFRPRDYVVRSIAESGAVLNISGEAGSPTSALFAEVRANMPMQGWEETQVRTSGDMQLLAYEKAGYRAQFTLFPQPGDRTQLDLEMRGP